MTHSPPGARPSAPSAEYRWTNRKAHAFLDALAQHGKVAAAARAVGMTRQSACRLRDRIPVVAEGWARARAQAIGRARRRGEVPKVTVMGLQRLFRLPKATLSGTQVDAFSGQGDTFAAQGDGFALQGDGFAEGNASPPDARQHPTGSRKPLAPHAAIRKGARAMIDETLTEAARVSKAWPFQEAMKLVKRFPEGKPGGAPVLFETGYGPSGLPHIGTFQEVLRTTLVRRAYEIVSGGAPTRLVAFSDDMDGLRKVPDNLPSQELLLANLGKPLSRIPDPFGAQESGGGYESFAHHNNAMLRMFLDRFGFDYEFVAASDRYNSGAFDDALRLVLERFDAVMDIMLPTLRAERQATYSPVLPISEKSGVVLQVPVEVVDAANGIVRFEDEGETVEQCVFGGQAKLQWKVDWAMRWFALGVDYEMSGKDLTDSVTQSGRIIRALGGRMPEVMIYELFLDANGEKISKSRGNGFTFEEWMRYGTEESLGFYVFREPKSAKQLHAGIVPRAVDEYWQFRAKIPEQPLEQQLGNPVWHLLRANGYEGGDGDSLPVPYSLLLNLIGVLGAGATREQVWSYLGNYIHDADPAHHPELDALVDRALAYNRDFVAPTLHKRAPAPNEAAALRALDGLLAATAEDASAEDLQTEIYEIGKREEFAFGSLRDWFKALYETLLGSSQGPRMGSFIALYGVANTRALVAEALARQG